MSVTKITLLIPCAGSAEFAIDANNALAEDLTDWSGFHIGSSIGVSFDRAESEGAAENLGGADRWLTPDVPLVSNAFGSLDLDDLSGSIGVNSGYTMQSGHWLYGIDLSGQLRNVFHEEVKEIPYSGGGTFTVQSKISSNWEASLTPRIGYAFDRWAISGHAGVAVSNVEVSANFLDIANVIGSGRKEETVFGVVGGLGVDYALDDSWSIGSHYSYTKYQSVETPKAAVSVGGVATTSVFEQKYALENHGITLDVKYRF